MQEDLSTYRIQLTHDVVKRVKHVIAELGVTTKKFHEDAVEYYTMMQEALLKNSRKH